MSQDSTAELAAINYKFRKVFIEFFRVKALEHAIEQGEVIGLSPYSIPSLLNFHLKAIFIT